MKKVQVFDPAMCCSSGVCGVEVDQQLVAFAADVDWAKQNGAQIERFNLAQQPMAFAENAVVKDLLERSGQNTLPFILMNGEAVLTGRYPTRGELSAWLGITPQASIFTSQVAELVAIGAAIASNCEACFKFHFDAARKLGVSNADMLRAVDLAQKVKDSPARAVCDLADRYLHKDVAAPAAAGCGNSNAKVAGGCCFSSAEGAAKSAS
jgi:AhpD family alkylhydroperoxidase